jgi:hypothetical protein
MLRGTRILVGAEAARFVTLIAELRRWLHRGRL